MVLRLFSLPAAAPAALRKPLSSCGRRRSRPTLWLLAIFVVFTLTALRIQAAALTVRTNVQGPTPTLLGYNFGPLQPGSNTRDWWRYSGVTGARMFISPSLIEPSDDLPPWGDGVNSEASFLDRRAAVRARPLDPAFINWASFSNRYESDLSGTFVAHGLREVRRLGIQICAQITASTSSLPLRNDDDWAGKWELWQHYYAQAFYLAREFGVQRFQMFNEPNHSSAGGLTHAQFLVRLQLASDAIQCALTDVNRLYGTALAPRVLAPVTAGTADGAYPGWGEVVVTNRHRNFLGQPDAGFQLAQVYDYHQYNSQPASFGTDLADLRARLRADLAPESPWPVAISEFNVHTAATFDSMTDTLDSPAKYSRFASIVVNLAANACSELYVFKFSQTLNGATVKKNGMHFVDNTNAPANIGGITRAGEAWRLFNKAFAPGRLFLEVAKGPGAESLDVLAARDPAADRCFLYCVNNTAVPVDLAVDFTAWGVPVGNAVLLEEVSELCAGGGAGWIQLDDSRTFTGTQAPNSIWLFTVPATAQASSQVITACDDAMVRDGNSRHLTDGGTISLRVRHSPTNAADRCAAFLKFQVPRSYPPDIQFALLTLHAASISGAPTAPVHVYCLTNSQWAQTSLAWANAPNLAQGRPPGITITNNVVIGAGDSAELAGQLVAGGIPAERTLDVTDFVRRHAGGPISFLLAREVRFHGDAADGDGLTVVATEAGAAQGPRLQLVRRRDSDGDGLSDLAETSNFRTDPANPDSDGDTLSDGDEILIHRTNPAGADTDGDGVRDADELKGGTNPLDNRSYLRIVGYSENPQTRFRIEWPAVTNRYYRLYRAAGLADETWQEIFAGPGTNGLMSHTDQVVGSPASTSRPVSVYRLRVEP